MLWRAKKKYTIALFCYTPSLKLDGHAMMVALLFFNHVTLVEAIMARHMFQPYHLS